MAVTLVFGRAPHASGPVQLVFGAGLTPPTPDPLTLHATVVLGGMSAAGVVLYDNRNPRRASTAASLPHQVAARVAVDPASTWQPSARRLDQRAVPWQQGVSAAAEPGAGWVTSARRLQQTAAPWELAAAVQTERSAVHQRAAMLRTQAQAPWGTGTPASHVSAIVHQAALSLVRQHLAPWQLAQALQALVTSPHQVGVPRVAGLLMPWQTGRAVPPGREVWPPLAPVTPPREINTHLVFACPPWLGGPVHLVFGRVCKPDLPTAAVVVPVRSVYMIVNTASLRRVSNNQSIPTYSTSLSIDADSWTWGFQAVMPADALGMIQRVSPAEPVEVELTINGQPYRALIESAVRTRTFKDWQLTVRGRGLGAVLDTPYAPQRLFSNAAERTAQQLAGDALTIGGEGFGWGVEWNIDDWLVPADAWNHRGSMISAVNAIAAAAGAYVQPHPTSQTLRVLPRYPSAPWEWGTVTPDIHLPAAVMSVEGIEWVDRPAYNRVFVSGVQAGVNGQVTRAGTAGDLVAGMVTDPLITAVEAARQRGTYELSKGGTWAEMSLKLPVLAETGVIHPGKFVRYNDGDVDRLGIVRSTNVQDDGTDIWQTIGVESYVA